MELQNIRGKVQGKVDSFDIKFCLQSGSVFGLVLRFRFENIILWPCNATITCFPTRNYGYF
jgi:hypothetical protein